MCYVLEIPKNFPKRRKWNLEGVSLRFFQLELFSEFIIYGHFLALFCSFRTNHIISWNFNEFDCCYEICKNSERRGEYIFKKDFRVSILHSLFKVIIFFRCRQLYPCIITLTSSTEPWRNSARSPLVLWCRPRMECKLAGLSKCRRLGFSFFCFFIGCTEDPTHFCWFFSLHNAANLHVQFPALTDWRPIVAECMFGSTRRRESQSAPRYVTFRNFTLKKLRFFFFCWENAWTNTSNDFCLKWFTFSPNTLTTSRRPLRNWSRMTLSFPLNTVRDLLLQQTGIFCQLLCRLLEHVSLDRRKYVYFVYWPRYALIDRLIDWFVIWVFFAVRSLNLCSSIDCWNSVASLIDLFVCVGFIDSLILLVPSIGLIDSFAII